MPIIAYDSYRFLYPPRPDRAVSPSRLSDYDNGEFLCEFKLDGDCACVFTNGIETVVKDRHGNSFKKDTRALEAIAKTLHRGNGWIGICAEWLCKSKKNSLGANANGNLVLWDLIILNGCILTNYSHESRKQLLDDLYATGDHSEPFLLATDNPHVQVVKHYLGNFENAYDSILKVPMIEGLVLKKRKALLELGLSESNNARTMLKFRKPTENYHY